MKKPTKKITKKPNEPEYFEPKPNPMFPEWLTAMLSFVRYPEAVPCEHCGRRSRHHWTLCVPFTVSSMESGVFHLVESTVVFRRFAPVCRAHMLHPAFRTPTADAVPSEADTLVAALNDMDRELSVRGPGGYAFRAGGRWFTVGDIDSDPAKRVSDAAGHDALASALARIAPESSIFLSDDE